MFTEQLGWIKVHRKLITWEWYKKPNMVHLFLHLLLSANREDGRWQSIEVKRGQLITGRNSLSEDTGISVQSIRTCLINLKSTNELTIKSTKKYSLITICKYEEYQLNEKEANQGVNQQTNPQLTINQPSTNHKQEDKKIRSKEKRSKPIGDSSKFLDRIIQTYSEEHGDYKVLNPKKEREYTNMILKEYKSNNPNSDEEKTIADLRVIFNGCINIDDQWKRDNMCIRYIANNYNVLKQYFKNGKSTGKKAGVTGEQLASSCAKVFVTDKYSEECGKD